MTMTCKKCGAETPENALYCPFCGKPINYTPTPKKRGNGQGTAIKRGKTWTGFSPGYSFTGEDGKLHRVRPSKGGFSTKKEALLWASSQKSVEKPLPRLIDLWQGYSANDLKKLSKNKQTAYKIARKRLESIISRRIDTLSVDDLQAVVNKECSSYYPAKDMKSLLSKLYQRAMASNANKGRVTQNLSDFIVLPELDEKEATPFTEQEVKLLWQAYEKGDTFIGYILLLCYTGMMPGELLECKKDMVDMEHCEIRGAGAKTKVRKQTAIVFPVFIKPLVEDLLSIRVENSNTKNDKLLTMNKDNFYKEFYEAIERAGINNPICFTCDPYPTGFDSTPTREIIKLLKEHGNHVQILTKGDGSRDFDLLDSEDWYGITFDGVYTGVYNAFSRFADIGKAHSLGIKTWCSFEPVVDADSVLDVIENASVGVFDKIKIGKLNYHKSDIDWKKFGMKAEALCKELGIEYYIKESLRAEMNK